MMQTTQADQTATGRSASGSASAQKALDLIASTISGEVRSDRLTQAIYATDASIYEMTPDGVVLPNSVDDVCAAVRICNEHRVPITPRGAGTGLAGGAVNRGVQLDLSRYMNKVIGIDLEQRTARVQPGVVLDELNAAVAEHGLHFAPDVATSSRATIGGMIANNSCGAHSVMFERTVNHVLSVDVVLSDGSRCTWGSGDRTVSPLGEACEQVLRDVAIEHAAQIAARYPKVMRKNGGYALDRLTPDSINPETVICGSEGTLAIVTAATLKLTPLPKFKGLVVAHFTELLESLAATPVILTHKPAAVELIDNMIVTAARGNPALARKREFIVGDPASLLIIELYDDDQSQLNKRLQDLANELSAKSLGYAHPIIVDSERQAHVWDIRKSGLGLLMSKPGDRQPYAFVEDTAVSPDRLRDYIERFYGILNEEGVTEAGCYAHASVGCLHIRPVLNLQDGDDVRRMRRVADRISTLALEFGGTMTGEHGDGLLRSEWLEKMYGPVIIDAFRKIKDVFDPVGILNPGKIVDPQPMDRNLRFGEEFKVAHPLTVLDFRRHGGMAGLASMCSGVGQCRQRLVGTMCPSYMATGDETHTTRARANALRLALSNRSIIEGLSDPVLDEVMDLCLMCKACKTECPTGTDMAKLKAEWLAHKYRTIGAPKSARFIAAAPQMAVWGSRFAPLSNWIAQSPIARALLEKRYGLDRRVPPPRFVRRTFRKWYGRYRKRREPDANKPVVAYFVDTWTNFHTPQVGIAAVESLEALGYRVVCPPTPCCGRPLISKGFLTEAQVLAEEAVEVLTPLAQKNIPIIGTEPSCILTLADEFPQLVRSQDAQRIAELAFTFESFVARVLESGAHDDKLQARRNAVQYHGHCHQKAMVGTADAMAVLSQCDRNASLINSGCCGMAGSFGHEHEHYDVARDVGEQRLFPAVRENPNATVVISGFSCRHQIEHHTQASPRHVAEILAESLGIL